MPTADWIKRNPLRHAYNCLKNNAKRRGKYFNLTYEQFKDFAIKTKYVDHRGRTADSYHIDRIDENEGYTIDNIQVLSNKDNVRKFFNHYYDEGICKYVFKVETVKENNNNNSPF